MPMLMSLFSWWYGDGWKQIIGHLKIRTMKVLDSLSVIQLVKTLFSPWKRIVTDPGRSLEGRLKAAVDNGFSRVVGFVVRLFVLLASGLFIFGIFLLSLIEILGWPMIPLAVPGLIILGFLI